MEKGKTYRARVVKVGARYEVLILISGLWRSFGTPYNAAMDEFKRFREDRTAERGADIVALELGIKLEWED